MYCKECGTILPEGATYCPECGSASTVNQATYSSGSTNNNEWTKTNTTTPTYQNTTNYTELSKSILTKGILALVFSCTFWLSFLGIVFGCITSKRTQMFCNAGNVLTGKAKVGSILGKVGLILGIVLTAIFVIYLLVAIIAAVASTTY